MIEQFGWLNISVGFATAAVAAAASMRWMVGWLNTRGLGVFAAWRIGLAIVVAALLVSGRLAP
jgi:undecaprenyl-diphosphatase